jgi:hypothetical protein
MSTFAVTSTDELVDAVNYVLANLGQGGNAEVGGNVLTVDTTTGIISQAGSINAIAYLYQYINIRYADDGNGTGFSTSPTNKGYYGILNSAASSPVNLNNPASYQWKEVTGGFGTTKFLYYTTFGGRQIAFTVATASPNVFYAQAIDSTPIDLDFVLSTQALPVVVLSVFRRATSAPATPTGGTYDFSTLTLTPPAGWSASVPTGTDPFYSSQNTFTAPTSGSVAAPDLAWTTPVLTGENGTDGTSVFVYTVFQQSASAPATPGASGSYNFGTTTGTPPTGWSNTPVSTNTNPIWATTAQATTTTTGGTWTATSTSWSTPVQYTGAGGVDGTRGFIPMGYVVTTQNPTTAPGNTTANLTAAFSAARTNPSAPIGTGYAPIAGDTASFTWSSNTAVNAVYTYSSANVWQPAAGQVINGNVFVTGSVNASALNANDVYALNLRGGNVTVGTYAGTGYWFQSSTGNAYIAGNLVIGNNANIGNNLTIGNSVTIQGVTLNGALVANIVGSSQLTTNAVTAGKIATDAVTAGTIAANAVQAGDIAANAVTASTIQAGAITTDKMTAGTINGNIITANTLNGNVIIANTISGNTIIANTIAANAIVANSITASQISSAYIYAGNIVSLGATSGSNTSPGYWLAYNTGDARFGGNVSIGSNLTVDGLITASGLNANTVQTTTMLSNAVSNFGAISFDTVATLTTSVTFPGFYDITDTSVGLVTSQNNQNVYVWAALQPTFNMTGMGVGETFDVDIVLSRYDFPSYANEERIAFESYTIGGVPSSTITTNFVGFYDSLPVAGNAYVYLMTIYTYNQVGTFTVNNILVGPRSILIQTLKR